MPLRDLFSSRGRENQQFAGWTPPPAIRPVPIKTEGVLRASQGKGGENKETQEEKYPSTLIVTIGKTGEQVLSLLTKKISQGSTVGSGSIRALAITDSAASIPTFEGRQIRALELQRPPNARDQSQSRAAASRLFQQAVNYKRYQGWLQENLLDLGGDIQVFFIGSLAEPSIGLLGDALQILINFSRNTGRTGIFSRVCAFLSMRASSSSSMPAEEIFAASREIGRFTFNGPHVMNASFEQSLAIEGALLDYLFVLDDFLPLTPAEKKEDVLAQLLADSIFSLLHPSARFLWENLLNDLSLAGQIRQNTHQPVVNSIGTATLYIPLNEIKRYTAARLARAVMFGEQANVAEGLLKPAAASLKENPQTLARRFLLDGPFPHPVYGWLLDANSPAYFNKTPDLSMEFLPAFQAQIVHSLTRYLNQPPLDLDQAREALSWLDGYLANCEGWFKSSKPSNPNAPERFTFQRLLFVWRETLQYLNEDLSNWQKKFFSSAIPEIPALASVPSSSDWRRAAKASQDGIGSAGAAKTASSASLFDILKVWRLDAEGALANASNDYVYRSALSEGANEMTELETYYADTVRPELSRIGSGAGVTFTNIRGRLEWWIHLVPDRLPQIYLVCWPASMLPSAEPPPEVRFGSGHIPAFADSLVKLALSQTETLEADLTTNWFARRIRHLSVFLRRAGEAYLEFDHNLAAQTPNAASRRSYLIAHGPTLGREFVDDVFPNALRREINELAGGQKTRFTALTLRLNIPFKAVSKFDGFQREYMDKAPESVHLFSQERAAAAYEKRHWKMNRERIMLVPEIAILLADPQLVTLFFQALFVGLVHVEQNDLSGQSHWVMDAIENFPSLRLAPTGQDGLLLALRRFALELPNASDITQNPHNHFHPANRSKYISVMIGKVKELAFKPEARSMRDSLKQEFDDWKSRAEQDELARSFYVLIECELDEPVWAGW
jgi:hypothetical protein